MFYIKKFNKFGQIKKSYRKLLINGYKNKMKVAYIKFKINCFR